MIEQQLLQLFYSNALIIVVMTTLTTYIHRPSEPIRIVNDAQHDNRDDYIDNRVHILHILQYTHARTKTIHFKIQRICCSCIYIRRQ